MKYLLLLLLIPAFGSSQRIALLSKDYKKPILYTDSVTVEQMVNYFPVEIKSFDTLYASLNYLKQLLTVRQRSKMQSFEFHCGFTVIKTEKIIHAYGDHFRVTARSKVHEISSSIRLAHDADNNKTNSRRIARLMEYMQTNKSLFTSPSEMQPVMKQIVMISGY